MSAAAPAKPRVSVIASQTAVVNGPPLDYSFKELTSFAAVPGETPTSGRRKAVKSAEARQGGAASGAASGAAAAGTPAEEGAGDGGAGASGGAGAGAGAGAGEKKSRRKVITTSVRFCNNQIEAWAGFEAALVEVLPHPGELTWIDCSFNKLKTIDAVVTLYPKLTTLHLQCNEIQKLSEVDKLKALPHLKALALHGNPIENRPNYRNYVISAIPTLQKFDFSIISKQDRDKAMTWRKNRKTAATAAASK